MARVLGVHHAPLPGETVMGRWLRCQGGSAGLRCLNMAEEGDRVSSEPNTSPLLAVLVEHET